MDREREGEPTVDGERRDSTSGTEGETDDDRSPAERPQGRSDVVFRPLAEEWVIYDPAADRLHVLNLTASLVWTSADGTRSVEEIVEEVVNAFDSKPDRNAVRDDVITALDRFLDEGLLVEPSAS